MAVPANAQILRGAPLKVGILLGVSPSSDPTFDVEIVRATSSGTYSTVARLTNLSGGVPATYEDLLPFTTQTFSYKARAVKAGWLAGDYTAAVSARPTPMPEILPKITPVTGQQLGAPLFISTGAPPQYGKANSQQYYDASLDVYPFEFTSTANAVTYSANEQRLYNQTTAARTYRWKSVIPNGSSVGQIDLRYQRPSTKGSLRFRIQTYTVVGGGITATYVDYTATGTTGSYLKSFTSGFAVGNVPLFVRVDMTSTIGTTASVQLNSMGFTYKKPNVGVSV